MSGKEKQEEKFDLGSNAVFSVFSTFADIMKKIMKFALESGFFAALATAQLINTVFTGKVNVNENTKPTEKSPDTRGNRKSMKEEAIEKTIEILAKQGKDPKEIEKIILKNFRVNRLKLGEYRFLIFNECNKHILNEEDKNTPGTEEQKESNDKQEFDNDTERITSSEQVQDEVILDEEGKAATGEKMKDFNFQDHQKDFEIFIEYKYQKSFNEFMSENNASFNEEYELFCSQNNLTPCISYLPNDVYDYLIKNIVENNDSDIIAVTKAINNKELSSFSVDYALVITKYLHMDNIKSQIIAMAELTKLYTERNNTIVEMKSGNGDNVSYYTDGDGSCKITLFNDRGGVEGAREIDLNNDNDMKLLCNAYYKDFNTQEFTENNLAELIIDRALYEYMATNAIELKNGSEIIIYSNEIEKDGIPEINKTICYAEKGSDSAHEITLGEAYEIYKAVQFDRGEFERQEEMEILPLEDGAINDMLEKMSSDKAFEKDEMEFMNDVYFRNNEEPYEY